MRNEHELGGKGVRGEVKGKDRLEQGLVVGIIENKDGELGRGWDADKGHRVRQSHRNLSGEILRNWFRVLSRKDMNQGNDDIGNKIRGQESGVIPRNHGVSSQETEHRNTRRSLR